MKKKNFWCLLLLIALAMFACGEEDDNDNDADDDAVVDDDTAADDDQADDDAVDDDTAVDSISSASPERDSSLLNQDHSGWVNASCFSCHQDVHRGGFALGECVTCHGGNGAPYRAAGHSNGNCAECHAGKHDGLGFSDPQHCTACHKYDPDVTCPVTEEYDVVVIGAGGGGLGAAAALALGGLKVALVEKQYKVGGYMTTFHRGDYTFEASLHAIGGLDPHSQTKDTIDDFLRLDIMDRIVPIKSDPMYRSVFPGRIIDIPSDLDEYKGMLTEMFPAQADGIAALVQDMRETTLVLDAVTRMQKDFDLADLWIVLSNPQAAINLLRYLGLDLAQMLAEFIDDPELIGIWSQMVTYVGAGPSDLQALFFNVMWSSYHLTGFYYLEGGSQSISDALAEVIRENGGDIKLNTLATKIVIEDGVATQVQTKNDACLNTRYVVSNANAPDTLLNMVGEQYLPTDYVTKLNNMEIGVATLQVFLGVDHDYTDLFPGTHEIMVNESYDMDLNFEYMNTGMIDLAPYIITNYTASDPTMSPPGKNTISLTTYMPFDLSDTWQWDQGYDDYIDFKEEVAQVLIERAEEYLPGLSQHIEILEVGSPVTNYAYSLNPRGTIFGWSNIPEQGTLRRLAQQTPIDNLILAGAWTFPGGGQSAVINSGILAADMILKREGKK